MTSNKESSSDTSIVNETSSADTIATDGGIESNATNDGELEDVHHWTIDTTAQTIQMSDQLWGAFFEDINRGADQGLYAELVLNRSFEEALAGWYVDKDLGSDILIRLDSKTPLNDNNLNYVTIDTSDSEGYIYNQGLTSMAFQEKDNYNFSVYLRKNDPNSMVEVALMDQDKTLVSAWSKIDESAQIDETIQNELGTVANGSGFDKYSIVITPDKTLNTGRLVMKIKGNVDIDMVSLMPESTYKQRENGMREDLATLIEQVNPSFFRFPGGCIVEGNSLENAYQWKDTIGDVALRKENENLWGYQQSYGIGFYEYFQYCEDINTEPLPVINVGMACQARTTEFVPLDALQPYIQDALDLIEFANGDTSTVWGSVRAEMGHVEPFNMKYLAIGNEQWGSDYYFRYDKFAKAIREAYPDIKLIFAAGPLEGGTGFDSAWRYASAHIVDLVDEHYYMSPEWFFTNTHRYDDYDRNGPGVFIGEYAAHSGSKQNDLLSALAEAAFMTGIERNADIVKLASYAPLLAFEKKQQWSPDLIWFDNDQSYATPNYYVQKLFSTNRGIAYLQNELTLAEDAASVKSITGAVGIGTWETQAAYKNILITDNETGEILYENSGDSMDGLKINDGDFSTDDGAIVQSSLDTNCFAVVGKKPWTNYTIECDAKKISGNEGFLLMFGVEGTKDFYWWNVGGWGNTQSAIEKSVGGNKSLVGNTKALHIDQGQWYRLKITVQGENITCMLDNTLVHQVKDPLSYDPIYTSAVVDENGDIILKYVNATQSEAKVETQLSNLDADQKMGTKTVLSGKTIISKNSLNHPDEIIPITTKFELDSDQKEIILEPYSLTIIRLTHVSN